MSSSQTDKRIDPLIDAYRQASEFEAQDSGARPNTATRAAVLAHARVVAQSASVASAKPTLGSAMLTTPAANESRPIWRIAAGVVLGLAGMWVYQLTRPGTTGEANVAVLSARQSAKTAAAAGETTGAPMSPAVVAPSPATAQPESTVAVATPPSPATTVLAAPIVRAAPSRERVDSPARFGASVAGADGASRDATTGAARGETSVALAKVAAPLKQTESPAQVAAAPVLAALNPSAATTAVAAAAPTKATGAATSASAESATSEPLGEIAVAAADTRKLARETASRAPAAAPPTAPPPNAFPATTAGAMAQSAPQAAASGAIGNMTMRQGVTGGGATPDAAMFSAIRVGNVTALRAAIARGANVNARDEAARSALQIARERSDVEMVKALELAGAK